MDEFTSRIEELNSKVSVRKVSASQQNLALQADGCSAPSSLFGAGIGNGLMSGSLLPNSSSSSQLARESAFMEEVISRFLFYYSKLFLFIYSSPVRRVKDSETVSSRDYDKKDALPVL